MKTHILKTRWLCIELSSLDTNHHGPEFTTLRSGVTLVRMNSYAKHWGLYRYRPDGSCWSLYVCFPRWRGAWPKDWQKRIG